MKIRILDDSDVHDIAATTKKPIVQEDMDNPAVVEIHGGDESDIETLKENDFNVVKENEET